MLLPPPSREEMRSRLEAMPLVRDAFAVRVIAKDSRVITLKSAAEEWAFGSRFHWNDGHKGEASITLPHAYSLESIRRREHFGRCVLDEKLVLGDSVLCELVA